MGKKNKTKVKRSAKKAMKAIKKHKPTSALVALGGFAASILSSEKLRTAVEDLLESMLGRAAKTMSFAREGAGDVVKRLTSTDGDEAEAASPAE